MPKVRSQAERACQRLFQPLPSIQKFLNDQLLLSVQRLWKGPAMWDVRYATLAAMRLQQQQADAAEERQAQELVVTRTGRWR